VEVGLQVEHFKEQNVRFIAADDHYDSTVNEDDLMFPMRNVMNEMYNPLPKRQLKIKHISPCKTAVLGIFRIRLFYL